MYEVIVNPAGGNGRTGILAEKLRRVLAERNLPARFHFSSLRMGIEDLTRSLSEPGEDRVLVVVGGDGTMNQAVNGLQDFARTKVAFLSFGSGNDLARGLKLPRSPEAFADMLEDGKTKAVDVGVAAFVSAISREGKQLPAYERRFLISCGIGFDAAICEAARAGEMKKTLNNLHMGKFSYIYEAMKVIFQTAPAFVKIKDDSGEKVYEKLLMAACMNQPFEGGGFMFAPQASGDDGILDLCTADNIPKIRFFQAFPFAYSGNHVRFPGVCISRSRTFEICSDRMLWVHTDGETDAMADHLRIGLAEEKLQMIVKED